MPLILASGSPRRLALLSQIGITPDKVVESGIDEKVLPREVPQAYVQRMARAKAQAVAANHPGKIILSADTVVACGRRILPKAENNEEVEACLKLLSGRRHRVLTAVCVLSPEGKAALRMVSTHVMFKRLGAEELAGYIKSGEGLGKAGGYAIQGRAGAFVQQINGSYSAVVGLPLCETKNLLMGAGYGG